MVILKAQAVQFNKLLRVDGLSGESASSDSAAVKFSETLHKAPEDGEYTDDQLYNCETTLYYKLLPNKSLDLKKAPSKVGMKTYKE
jgi:hypothetical protein